VCRDAPHEVARLVIHEALKARGIRLHRRPRGRRGPAGHLEVVHHEAAAGLPRGVARRGDHHEVAGPDEAAGGRLVEAEDARPAALGPGGVGMDMVFEFGSETPTKTFFSDRR
jgi:hypothetical protein